DDPGLAIGTAKELVETCCKTILRERGIEFSKSADLPELVKLTSKELELTPHDIAEKTKASDTIKRLLSNLATITQGIAELRNQYGTGHGKAAGAKGLQSRHAKLAVGAASTLAVFLSETHAARLK
ncbi:MAG: abortive infection family protein, partial [Acidiferrobacteraceae bacterium]